MERFNRSRRPAESSFPSRLRGFLLRRLGHLSVLVLLVSACQDSLPVEPEIGESEAVIELSEPVLSIETGSNKPFADLASGHSHNCGVRTDGTISCWGSNDSGQSNAPGGSGFIDVAAGNDHSCGLRSEGDVVCWGGNGYGQLSPPTGVEFATIEAGTFTTCGVTRSQAVRCWGRQNYSSPAGSAFTSATAGQGHVCALALDGSIVCEGSVSGNSVDPSGSDFVNLDTGANSFHTCGVRESGAVACWGSGDDGVAHTPTTLAFVAVSSGYDASCGVRDTGWITCWGELPLGMDSPPEGPFAEVDMGALHACALTRYGAVKCWGWSGSGALNAPGVDYAFAVPGGVSEGQTFALALDTELLPGLEAVSTYTFAFDCGDGSGYGAFSETPTVTCAASADDDVRPVRATARDQDGHDTQWAATVAVGNANPEVTRVSDHQQRVRLGTPLTFEVDFTDQGLEDTWTGFVRWDLDLTSPSQPPDETFEIPGGPGRISRTHTYTSPGLYVFSVRVGDDDGGLGGTFFLIDVYDPAPAATFVTPSVVAEGGTYALTLEGAAVPGSDDPVTFSFAFDCGDGGGYGGFSSDDSATCEAPDAGLRTVKGTVRTSEGFETEYTSTVTIENVAPTITTASESGDIVTVGNPVELDGLFTDPGLEDTHTATIDWGDGTTSPGTVLGFPGGGEVSASHAYDEAGVYEIVLTVSDDDGGSHTVLHQYVVVYDPSGGFVTGAGSIDSPAGAFAADPELTGLARFAFVSRYAKGANRPSGRTDFRFQAGDLRFEAESYDFLIVNQGGTNAQFRGAGLINGERSPSGSEYDFMIWASDGTPDTFRIRIVYEGTDGSDVTVYDNEVEQAITVGQIAVHKGPK